ncbi:MAG: ATP-binding cassette domain-containing protein [Erysipelotrichaceae bacterium]|nr:ATP-binding cassette domain-containing protein [Erysipelotrichaceae bacterium]
MSVDLQIKKQLEGFGLDVRLHTDKKRIGILGSSGSGKSMTLKCIAGIVTPDQGKIETDGRLLFDSESRHNPAVQKRKVGYLFQNYALFPNMTVGQNILAGVKKPKAERGKILKELLEKFQLDGLENRLPSQLSGGQQQRTALARILASEPSVILLDEPFSALDVYLKDQMEHELYKMLEDFAGTVILVSHSRDEIYRFSEELLVIDQGKTVCQGPVKEIFQNPEYVEAARLTGCKNIASAGRMDEFTADLPEWNVSLHTLQPLDLQLQAVGIRAHQLIPVWDQNDPSIVFPVDRWNLDELPFERKYYFYCTADSSRPVCWFVQRDLWDLLDEKGFPCGFKIDPKDILYLK